MRYCVDALSVRSVVSAAHVTVRAIILVQVMLQLSHPRIKTTVHIQAETCQLDFKVCIHPSQIASPSPNIRSG